MASILSVNVSIKLKKLMPKIQSKKIKYNTILLFLFVDRILVGIFEWKLVKKWENSILGF